MKKEFVVEREGKSFVLYAGLLDLAHERGLKAITTTLVQIPNEMNGNMAICHATVETERGTFTGLGDACPTNVTRMMAPHLIRMAETRAKARALRDAVNVGVTALEELADVEEYEDEPRSGRAGGRGQRGALRTVEHSVEALDGEPEHAAGRSNGQANGRFNGQAAGRLEQSGIDFGAGDAGPERPAGARAGGPAATPKQLETIARMARAAGKSVPTEGLSRAQASEVISTLIGEMGQLRAS